MAHTFTLTVKASGAAFHDEETDEYDPYIELARILRSTAETIRDDYRTNGTIVDSNGNVVGTFELSSVLDVQRLLAGKGAGADAMAEVAALTFARWLRTERAVIGDDVDIAELHRQWCEEA